MTTPSTRQLIENARKFTYPEYLQLLGDLLKEGKTTGPNQNAGLTEYAKLNLQRMKRQEKSISFIPELKAALEELDRKLFWVVITEGWCGDAAQNVPLLGKIAAAAPEKINLQLLLRDQNLQLMDRYLTNGGRSIPKLICFDGQNWEELGTWGPRPAAAQELFFSLKSDPAIKKEEFIMAVHQWYTLDKTRTMQHELAVLLRQWSGNRAK